MSAVAAVLTAPRKLELQEFALPAIGADDGLLRVEACGLCGTDWEQYKGELGKGLPIVPGHELFGTIEKIGREAGARWGVVEGDRVAVDASIPCGTCRECTAGAYKRCPTKLGYGMHVLATVAPGIWGGYATHAYLHPRAQVYHLPKNVPTATMSLFNACSNAVCWTIEVGGIGLGSSVLICGPGQRGLLAVVAAREAGAEQIFITGTQHDRRRLDVALQLGATAAIDVDAADPLEEIKALTGGMLVDAVVDVSALATKPIAQALDIVRPGGRIVLAGVKGHRPVEDFYSDKIFSKELQLVGVRSSGPTATRKAIGLIERNAAELAVLCTHEYDLNNATKAVRVLGREITDGPEAIHVHITGTL